MKSLIRKALLHGDRAAALFSPHRHSDAVQRRQPQYHQREAVESHCGETVEHHGEACRQVRVGNQLSDL